MGMDFIAKKEFSSDRAEVAPLRRQVTTVATGFPVQVRSAVMKR